MRVGFAGTPEFAVPALSAILVAGFEAGAVAFGAVGGNAGGIEGVDEVEVTGYAFARIEQALEALPGLAGIGRGIVDFAPALAGSTIDSRVTAE